MPEPFCAVTRGTLLALALAILGAIGCSRQARTPPHPTVCEVEITGRVRFPRGVDRAPPPLTLVALGDCLAPAASAIGVGGTTDGVGGTTDGSFFLEVFVPWGSDFTVCAASEPAPGQPSRLYGKAPIAMHAEKTGEVEYKDVLIELAPGPPRTFRRPAAQP